MRNKVLIISPNGVSDVGGVERVMAYAARILQARGKDVVILDRNVVADSKIGKFLARPLRSKFGYVWESVAMSYLASRLRDEDTIVIGNGYAACFAKTDILFAHGSARGSRLAKHSGEGVPRSGSTAAFARFVQRMRLGMYGPDERMEAMAGRRAQKVAAVSQKTADEWSMLYGIDRARIVVLPNAVDASHFYPMQRPDPGTEDDSTCSRASTSAKVLFVGRLEWRKGIDRLMKLADYFTVNTAGAASMILAENAASARIIIAAPSADGSVAIQSGPGVELMIGVTFKDLPALYRSCGSMYLPSRYEGFEMVTLEALASGTPVVGSSVGALAYLASLGFPGVYIVDPENLGEVAATLRRAAEEWADFRKKSELHDRVEMEFGLNAWASRFVSLLGEVDG